MLMPDCDEEGEAGFKDLLWRLSENEIETKLGMSSQMNGGQYSGKQPEDLNSSKLPATR